MAADSFHAKVEGAMRKMKKRYNFEDFDKAVSKDSISIEMDGCDFKLFGNELNRTGKDCKFPHM